ncbi:ribonuclease H-like domain-containing protein [Candidatus Micrarchaeota archaeon]|nr:ribonuclease H-like domain-containing protein [Candidatus Micrarchaeota archaeon]
MNQKGSTKRKAYFIDAGYSVKKGKTYVTLTLKGKKTVKLYYQYDPYFIVDAPMEKADELLKIKIRRKDGQQAGFLRIEEIERHVGLEKKKLLKAYCQEPSDVPIIRTTVPFPTYEDNIPFGKRFVFDMQLGPLYIMHYERTGRLITKIKSVKAGEPKLSAMAFDIETYNPGGAPIEEKDPIVMISYATEKTKGVITTKKSANAFVETVTDEKSMIERFSQIVKEEDPDVLVGYNSANFDIPYLQKRAEKTKSKLMIGKFSSQIKKLNKGLINGVRVDGRVHMDLFPMMKFFGFIGLIKAQRFTLDAVAEDVLGKKKVNVKKEEIWKLWDENKVDHLSDYSLVDSELTLALGERFLPLEIELAGVAKLALFETTISTSGQLVENLLMYHASEKEILIPSKPGGGAISERMAAPIQGAFVKLPEPGIYNNVAVLDFRGLYPSIIVSYNIDPGTLLSEKDGQGTDKPARHEQYEHHTSPSGAHFAKKEFGLIPFVLNYLIDLRMVLKKQLKSLDKGTVAYEKMTARSHALKILANSFYGYMGYARSRWYSRACAESVTAWGRKHISETIESAEKAGFQVLYADTDSVFLIYKDKKNVTDFMNAVNKALPEKMELELEGFYPRGVFVSKKGDTGTGAKKKYALLGEDGRIKIRGFELVRRDWSTVAKETQLKVLEAILKDGSKEKAVKIIREVVDKVRSGKMPLEMLSISTQLNKNPSKYEVKSPELGAAKKLRDSGVVVEKGTMISFVIGKKGSSISDKAVPIELAKDYDDDYYINHQILPAVMKIMKELGYDEHSMKFGGKQQTLFSD